jgi:hypothetical protein
MASNDHSGKSKKDFDCVRKPQDSCITISKQK